IGDLVVAPVLLTWGRVSTWCAMSRSARDALEPLALLLALVLTALVIFGPLGPQWLHHAQWVSPVLIWAALRFGQRGAAGATLVVSALAVWGTARGTGPFTSGALHERLEALQGYIGVQAATFLLLGAVVSQERAARQLTERALEVREEFMSVASHEL